MEKTSDPKQQQEPTKTHTTTTTTTTIAPASSSAVTLPFIKGDPTESPPPYHAQAQNAFPGLEEDGGQEAWDKDKPLRRKRRMKGQKTCTVCGDLAQSHNFGALTCETCKAFFRRNAFKRKELQICVFNTGCTITKATRRFCAPCRLKKCYSVGMDPELILDDEEKKARQSKRDKSLHIKKEQQQQESPEPTSNTSMPSSSSSGSCCGASSSCSYSNSPQLSIDSGIDNNATSDRPIDYPGKGKWCRPRNALGVCFKHVAREDLPWDMQLYWPLTVEERLLLTKLTSALQTVTTVISPEDKDRINQWDSFCMEKAIFALEFSMRQYVQYARCIPEFQNLPQVDQIATLKASALQWYHVRSASEFIPEIRSWVNVFGSISETQLGNFFGDMHGVKEYADFCEGIKFVVKNDMTLYALIHTLMLFDPRDPHIENRVWVNKVRDKYMVLLKHHLESQFSFFHADRYLAEVVEQMLDLLQLSQSSLVFYKHFSSQFRPLVAEVFNS
ncbi:hypothetical protein ACOMHN_029528 [Nucella lapillus]